jgi:cytoplasmic iron level regulating protein YaaA (DUF328/UPF0246 family)
MLIILSPAKIQNFKPQSVTDKYTQPVFFNEAEELINLLRPYPVNELRDLLNVSNEIAKNAADYYFNWDTKHNLKNAKQAVLTYNGEAYRGLNANSLSETELEYAQEHLRIISGLYGVLRPLDMIRPYRLELQTPLENSSGKDLYAFWKKKITQTIQSAIKKSGKPHVLLNLASKEYAKAINHKELTLPVIDFEFLENRREGYKTITIYTKKARGLMARYIIRNRIEDSENIKGFDSEGYWYNDLLSSENKMVFTRG